MSRREFLAVAAGCFVLGGFARTASTTEERAQPDTGPSVAVSPQPPQPRGQCASRAEIELELSPHIYGQASLTFDIQAKHATHATELVSLAYVFTVANDSGEVLQKTEPVVAYLSEQPSNSFATVGSPTVTAGSDGLEDGFYVASATLAWTTAQRSGTKLALAHFSIAKGKIELLDRAAWFTQSKARFPTPTGG